MAKDEDIIREMDYYLEHDVNIDEASKQLGISRRTFQLHMKKLQEIDLDKFRLITEKKERHIRQGNIVGGTLGKRKPTWTPELAEDVIKTMIEHNMTYVEAYKHFSIPKSTIHNMVQKTLSIQNGTANLYDALTEANRRHELLENYVLNHNNNHVTCDIVAKDIRNGKNDNDRRK